MNITIIVTLTLCQSFSEFDFTLVDFYSRGFTSGAYNEWLQVYIISVIIWEKSKCLLIVLAKPLYLDRVGRADFSGCHLGRFGYLSQGFLIQMAM